MAYSNDNFEKIARSEFQFLETDYSFRVHDVKKDVYGCFIMYKASTLAIRVSFEIYDGGVFVYVYKLKDGDIPRYPVFFDPHAEYLVFNFNNLMILRTKNIIEQDERRVYEDTDYMKAIVKRFADSLKTYAADLLHGDFSVFPAIHKIVIRRAKELEHEM